jgi:predicted enzyme related to lactoylglutathione lyase
MFVDNERGGGMMEIDDPAGQTERSRNNYFCTHAIAETWDWVSGTGVTVVCGACPALGGGRVQHYLPV